MQPQAVYNDFNSLANLRTAARQDADASLRDVAQQFESLFVQMMLKSMRDATMEGGLFDSDQLESYQQMHDQQLSLDLASRGGIGLADVLVEQLRSDRAALNAESDGGVAENDLKMPGAVSLKQDAFDLESYLQFPVPSQNVTPSTLNRPAATASWAPVSPQEFIDRLRPIAEGAARELGVASDVLLAQSALETGWGKHVSSGPGGSSNNFFNIKAGPDWTGPTVTVQTLEYRDGVAVRESARFRAYDSPEASFADYVSLIQSSPRYAVAKNESADAEAYLRELQRAGYATDPAYADKVMAIMDRDDLAGVTAPLKNTADLPLKS